MRFTPTPEETVTNTAFGGSDMRTLYGTAAKTLFQIRTEIAGLNRSVGHAFVQHEEWFLHVAKARGP
jgi:hypothetical protein